MTRNCLKNWIKITWILIWIPITSCDHSSGTSSKQHENWDDQLKNWTDNALEKGKKFGNAIEEKWKSIEINGFSVDDDIQMGKQLYQEIHKSEEYKILNKDENQEIYTYVESIKNKILRHGKLKYEKKFEWKITIIEDDSTINAFCAPGGYIFIYTGILKYLDNEAEFAGVLAHEMGHADRRHSTRQLTKTMGIQTVLDFPIGGENSQYYKDVIGGLLSLRYSRGYEREADECSVNYLCESEYKSDGGAGFFQKIVKEKQQLSSEFLSTHPDPEERIQNFKQRKKELNCAGDQIFKNRYEKKINKLYTL